VFDSFNISGSGMTTNRLWLDTISNNIANMNTSGRPGDPETVPYQRQIPIFAQVLQRNLDNAPGTVRKQEGVTITKIVEDQNDPRLVYNPSHPHADETGYVAYPNINITNEMANMMAATRAYEANATTLQAAKDIATAALQIGRG